MTKNNQPKTTTEQKNTGQNLIGIDKGAYPQIFPSSGTATNGPTQHLHSCLETQGHSPGSSIPSLATTLLLKKPVSWDDSKCMIENASFWQQTPVFQSNTERSAYIYWRAWEHSHSVSYWIARAKFLLFFCTMKNIRGSYHPDKVRKERLALWTQCQPGIAN